MSNELSYQEMKKIVADIYEEETKENNLNVELYPLTILEYYKDGMFKRNIKLTKKPIQSLLLPLYVGGYNISNEDIIVVF